MTGLAIFSSIIALGSWAVIAVLASELHRHDKRETEEHRRNIEFAEFDPGPLDDEQLRAALGPGIKRGRFVYKFPPSRTLDRIQNAFERLLREKRSSKARWLS